MLGEKNIVAAYIQSRNITAYARSPKGSETSGEKNKGAMKKNFFFTL